jgi:formylglycine-generating enzyme required for sulfatase activity
MRSAVRSKSVSFNRTWDVGFRIGRTLLAAISGVKPVFNPARASAPLTVAEEFALQPGDSFKECDACPEMVVVPAGSLMMGSPEDEAGRQSYEGPQHQVTLARPFAAGKFEVTFAEWDACVAKGGCTHRPGDEGWGRDKHPVVNVSWDDVTRQYLPWLSRKTGKSYRLLSEAEWEYVARAGTKTRFAFGDNITKSQVRYAEGLFDYRTAPVGSFPHNGFGLHDVHGNVWEWVQDCWNPSYNGAPADGSAWTSGICVSRVLRGGSAGSDPWYLRSALRDAKSTNMRLRNFGFRVGRTL